jgi:hypothetical protein
MYATFRIFTEVNIKIGPAYSSEMLMNIYQSTLHDIPEESNLFIYIFKTFYGNKCDMVISHYETGWGDLENIATSLAMLLLATKLLMVSI